MAFFASILPAACCRTFFVGYRIAMYVLGKYTRGPVVFGAEELFRLLQPYGTLNLDILPFLGYMAKFSDAWLGCHA